MLGEMLSSNPMRTSTILPIISIVVCIAHRACRYSRHNLRFFAGIWKAFAEQVRQVMTANPKIVDPQWMTRGGYVVCCKRRKERASATFWRTVRALVCRTRLWRPLLV